MMGSPRAAINGKYEGEGMWIPCPPPWPPWSAWPPWPAGSSWVSPMVPGSRSPAPPPADHPVGHEHEDRDGDRERADRLDQVPEVPAESVRVRVDAPGHPLKAED